MEQRRVGAEARGAAAPLSIESPVAATAGATPAAATLAGPGGKKGLPAQAGAPRLAPAGVVTAEKAEAVPAAKSTPFGKVPAKPATAEAVGEVEEEEAVKPAVPAKSAAAPWWWGTTPGERPPKTPAKKADEEEEIEEDKKVEPAKPATPVGNRPSPFGSPAGGAKPGSPFGAKPGGTTAAPTKSDDKD